MNSRYYNPEIHRFISVDDISYLDPETIGGLNLYAYCLNNPAMYADPTGHFWDTVFDILSIGFDILCLCKNKGWKDWKNWVALGLDIIFAIIPFIPSIMGRTLDVADAAYTVSKFDDVYDSIVIGNNMWRVTNMAMDTGSLVYKGYEALNALDNINDASKVLKTAAKVDNARWLMDKFYKGYKIIDVGRDGRSFISFIKSAYGMERRLLFFLRYGKIISVGRDFNNRRI